MFSSPQRLVLYQGVKKIPKQNREKLFDTLNVLESFLAKSKWFAGDELTIADFSILGTITTVKVSRQRNNFSALNNFSLNFAGIWLRFSETSEAE